MATLVLCAGCERHVRATEKKCPFCDAEVVATVRALEPMPGDRLLARTALTFAAAAAAMTTLAACGKESTEKPPAPVNTIDNPSPAPMYGPPPVMTEDASAREQTPAPTAAPTNSASNNDQHAPVPLYGVPPVRKK